MDVFQRKANLNKPVEDFVFSEKLSFLFLSADVIVEIAD
jgi:hypothetical protein